MTKYLSILFLFVSFSLIAQDKKMTTESFLKKPFPFEPTVKNFSSCKNPKFKLQKSIFKKHPTDTIYKFHKKRSELFINKSKDHEAFFAAIIRNKQVELRNGIHVGMEKKDVINTFTDINELNKPILELKNDEAKLNVTFI